MRDGSSRLIPDSQSFFSTAALSLDARYVASGRVDKVTIFQTRTAKLAQTWEGHTGLVRSVVFTPDGKGLLSSSYDKTVKYWDVSSLSMPRNVEGQGRSSETDGEKKAKLTFLGHTVSWFSPFRVTTT